MSRTVLVTGSTEHVAAVTAHLDGHEVVAITNPDEVASAVAGKQFDAYVQLPLAVEATGGSVVGRVLGFLNGGLLGRFRSAELVVPTLRSGARVVLVAGHTPTDVDSPDDQVARTALLRVLGHAIRADRSPEPVVMRVVGADRTPAEIARLALGSEEVDRASEHLSAPASELSYADWRTEILGLVTAEF